MQQHSDSNHHSDHSPTMSPRLQEALRSFIEAHEPESHLATLRRMYDCLQAEKLAATHDHQNYRDLERLLEVIADRSLEEY